MTCFARFRLVVTLSPLRSSLAFTPIWASDSLAERCPPTGPLLCYKLSAPEGFDVSVPGRQALPRTPS